METFVLDPKAVARNLESLGFTHEQAVANAQGLELLATPVVTKAELAQQTTKLIIWFSGALLAQGALVVALIEYLK